MANRHSRTRQQLAELMDWKGENMIDTLAMAYAEVGDFDSAVRYEEKALARQRREG